MKVKHSLRRLGAWFVLRCRWILKISHDSVSKHIFEHVRNLGLCAIVLGAGHYEQRNPFATGGLLHVIALGFLFAFGSFLYLLNMLNAYEKLKAAGVNKHMLMSWGNFYSVFTFVIINSLLGI